MPTRLKRFGYLRQGDFLFIAAILALFFGAFWIAKDWYFSAKLFPWFAAIPGAILCAVQLWRYTVGWEETHEARGMAVDEVYEQLAAPQVERRRTLEFWSWMVLTALGIWLLSMPIAAPLSMVLFARLVGKESWFLSLAIGLGTFALVWGLFVWGFNMAWPPGELFFWLDWHSPV